MWMGMEPSVKNTGWYTYAYSTFEQGKFQESPARSTICSHGTQKKEPVSGICKYYPILCVMCVALQEVEPPSNYNRE